MPNGRCSRSRPPATTAAGDGGGAFLYVPNIAVEVLDNDEVEEVCSRATRKRISSGRASDSSHSPTAHKSATATTADPLPRRRATIRGRSYRLRSDVPPLFHSVCATLAALSATSGETYLRRGRTIEAHDRWPQFRSRVVAESWRLNEAEMPRTGVRVRRTHRYARGSDGKGYFWIGRDKQTAPRSPAPGLRFDFLEKSSN